MKIDLNRPLKPRDNPTVVIPLHELRDLEALAASRLVLLRDLVEAFEAVCFYSDEVDTGYTAYNLAKKELGG